MEKPPSFVAVAILVLYSMIIGSLSLAVIASTISLLLTSPDVLRHAGLMFLISSAFVSGMFLWLRRYDAGLEVHIKKDDNP